VTHESPGERSRGFVVFSICDVKRMRFDIPHAQDEPMPGSPLHFALQADLHVLADTVLKIRALQALDSRATRFPIHRRLRIAVRRPLEELFDDLALKSGLAAHRLDTASLLLEGPGVFVNALGRRKPGYSSGRLDIWAESLKRLDEVRARVHDIAGEQRVREEIFTIDWRFHSPHFGLESVEFDELADPDLLDEAYPMLGEPVAAFIERYLNASETVLILQGPPGTGKTRLVRGILAALTRRKGDSARVLYTADRRTLENDEIFVEFITGAHEAFVIEDADHVLSARADGNVDLHRFLAVADGVVRALGRKIIFTTNLPNVGDLDGALVRPGRCFGIVRTRGLGRTEIACLIGKVTGGDDDRIEEVEARLPREGRTATLADVFRAIAARAESDEPPFRALG
jgi:ATPase family associated with various cellular activities (AAA)